MRLLTSIFLPEEEALNKRMIGRGERRKARIEEGEAPLPPPPSTVEVEDLVLAQEFGMVARIVIACRPELRLPEVAYRYACKAAHHARSVPRGTVGGPEGEAGARAG